MESTISNAKDLVKVGFVTVASGELNLSYVEKLTGKIKDRLRTYRINIIETEDIVTNLNLGWRTIKELKEKNIDLLLIVCGTWAPDFLVSNMAKHLEVPLIMWAPPEPLNAEELPEIGSLVGLTQTAGVLVKLGSWVKPIFDPVEEEAPYKEIELTLRVVATIKRLRSARIGLLGKGSPGMFDADYNPLQLFKIMGPETVFISIATLEQEIREVSTQEAIKEAEQDTKKYGLIMEPSKDQIVEANKIYLALKEIIQREHLNGIAIRCWPEFKQLNIMSPCLALSKLTEEGIMAGCEGDITGVVSMLILNTLTGRPSFLGDFLKLDEENNVGLMYHCGASAAGLAENYSKVHLGLNLTTSVWKSGVTVEFSVKPGIATLARLGESKGEYRMIVAQGEILKAPMFCRGNTVKMKFRTPVKEVLRGLIQNGAEHHQILVHGDVKEELSEFGELIGIKILHI